MSNRFADHDNVGSVAALMRLLGDPTRVRILGLLCPGEMNVTALCGELDLAQPTVSHHLGLLRNAKLLRTRRDGKQVHYSLNPEHITQGPEGLAIAYGSVRIVLGAPEGAESDDDSAPVGLNGAGRLSAAAV